jgi:FkbM family methyltransferase
MPNIFGLFNHRKPWEISFPRKATEADIVYCFRLLLDRKPSKQEWGGHVWRIGEDLRAVVTSYLNSPEFIKRRLSERQLGEWKLVDLPAFKIYASGEDATIGRIIIDRREYEREVTALFKKYLRPGMRVLDIGANIGYFSLLAASLVGPEGSVQSWEPSGSNVRALGASRAANEFTNIEIIQAAATDQHGLLKYFRNSSNGNVKGIGQTRPEDLLSAETVMGLRVDDFVPENTRIDFVKIDVEGFEYKAILGARKTIERCRPVIVTEFAPPTLEDASGVTGREYLEFFAKLGYDMLTVTKADPKPGSIDEVLSRFEASGSDHIDVVLLPHT